MSSSPSLASRAKANIAQLDSDIQNLADTRNKLVAMPINEELQEGGKQKALLDLDSVISGRIEMRKAFELATDMYEKKLLMVQMQKQHREEIDIRWEEIDEALLKLEMIVSANRDEKVDDALLDLALAIIAKIEMENALDLLAEVKQKMVLKDQMQNKHREKMSILGEEVDDLKRRAVGTCDSAMQSAQAEKDLKEFIKKLQALGLSGTEEMIV